MYRNQFVKILSNAYNQGVKYYNTHHPQYDTSWAKRLIEELKTEPSFFIGNDLEPEEIIRLLNISADGSSEIKMEKIFENPPFEHFNITGSVVDPDHLYKFCVMIKTPFKTTPPELDGELPVGSKLIPWSVETFLIMDDGIILGPSISSSAYVLDDKLYPFTYMDRQTSHILKNIPDDELASNPANRVGIPLFLYLLKLLNCKNIVVKDEISGGKKKKANRPELEYKVIHIKPNRVVYDSKNQPHETIPFHEKEKFGMVGQRRGHFKTFTQEKPLLGKHVGTWWWSPIFNVREARDYVISR